jgi:hypothetical protein
LDIPSYEDNIKIYLKEIGFEEVEWVYVDPDRD